MKRPSRRILAAGLATTLAVAACGGARPAGSGDAPGAAGVQPAPAPGVAGAHRDYTAADVRFVQRMLAHHAQALAMTALVPGRTSRADIRLLSERIEVSQRSEISLMRDWLRERGETVPGPDAHGAHHGAAGDSSLMPGMLTSREMARLAAAEGAEFERLFLELMIRHHEGALEMVAALFATPGAGEEPEIFRLASDVDADQRAEIRRLREMLDPPPGGPPRR